MSSYEEIEKNFKNAETKASVLQKRIEAKKLQIESLTLKNEIFQLELENRKASQVLEETKKQNEKRDKEIEKIKRERYERYLHASAQSGFIQQKCRYFIKGYCSKGDECTYYHPSDIEFLERSDNDNDNDI
jgi:hypothetical protein